MLKKIVFPLIMSLFIFALINSCGLFSHKYNINFPPPKKNPSYNDVFPQKIGNLDRAIYQIKDTGKTSAFEAVYGNNIMVIRAAQAPSPKEADQFFEDFILPVIDKQPNKARAKINGVWSGSATNKQGREYFGWTCQNWVFFIQAINKKYFKELVEAFPFISF